jgi:hypothetical protein
LADGAKVNIEVQLRNLGNMDRRSLFYWCREFISGINSGQDYAELPEVIAVNDEETIKKIIAMDTAIGKAQEKVAYVSRDAETLRLYNMRELALMDYVSGINHARREGMQEGMVIGEQKGMAIGEQKGIATGEQKALSEYVFKLSGKGKSIEEISELTDLSVEEVNEILNKRRH